MFALWPSWRTRDRDLFQKPSRRRKRKIPTRRRGRWCVTTGSLQAATQRNDPMGVQVEQKRKEMRIGHTISNSRKNLRIISRFINPLVSITVKFFPRCLNTPAFERSTAADNSTQYGPVPLSVASRLPSNIWLFSSDHGRPSPSTPHDAIAQVSPLHA